MRVVALTSFERGFASLAVPALADAGVDTARVVVAGDALADPAARRRRQLRKVRRIGVLGAANGIRMRRWYGEETLARLGLEDVAAVAAARGIEVVRTPSVNSEETAAAFESANADLGLSLGTGYIQPRVFSIPRHGMVNVHHELLPEFPGAQSVIWPIHEGVAETGYTIHRIDETIDGGAVLVREGRPIEFRGSLRETVVHNHARSWELSVEGLRRVLSNWEDAVANARPQTRARGFTTPTARQFARMASNHRRLARKARP